MILERNGQPAQIEVHHFHSAVVESMALVYALSKPNVPALLQAECELLRSELSRPTCEFLQHWSEKSPWDALIIADLLLPCGEFHSVQRFHQAAASLSDAQYLCYLLEESLPLAKIEHALASPSQAPDLDAPLVAMYANTHRTFIEHFFANIQWYRSRFANTLTEVAQSRTLSQGLHNHAQAIQDALTATQRLDLEPLALAQHLMGKTFRRMSAYKEYMFIPTYYMTPVKLRVFNASQCAVMYSVAEPQVSHRETTVKLELQSKALADQTRLRLLHLLGLRKEYGARLAEYLGVTTATVSHHLDVLRQAGFIVEEKVGNIKFFSLNRDQLDGYIHTLQTFIARE